MNAFILAWVKDTIKYISICKTCEANWLITWKLSAKNSSKLQSYDYTGTLEATVNAKSGTKNIEKKTISNSTSDQNTVLVQKNGILNIIDSTLKKTEDATSDDNANFYGLDSVVLANGKKLLLL